MEEYKDACTEVSVILSYLNKEEYEKIPKDVIEVIEKNKNKDYEFKLENNELKDCKLLEKTRAILFNIFRDYLCTEKQREIIKRQQREEKGKNSSLYKRDIDIEDIMNNRKK